MEINILNSDIFIIICLFKTTHAWGEGDNMCQMENDRSRGKLTKECALLKGLVGFLSKLTCIIN